MENLNNVSGAVNSAANQISSLQGVAQANSAFNAEQARYQREWTERQSAKAMAFNASEAAKNRDWQAMMSNTAHQREIKDLMAAGLNPVLSAMNGNGAAVTSGATASGVVGSGSKADADTSFSGAIANLLGSILQTQTALQSANINARTQEAVADKYTAMSEIVANINAASAIKSAGIHADATKYSADSGRAASMYSADSARAASAFASYNAMSASKYAADQARASSKYSADTSYFSARDNTTSVYQMAKQVGEYLGATMAGVFGRNDNYSIVENYRNRVRGSSSFGYAGGAGR